MKIGACGLRLDMESVNERLPDRRTA